MSFAKNLDTPSEPRPVLEAANALARSPRILCFVNHYYGENPGFRGKSTTQLAEVRRAIVERTLAALRKLGDVDVKVCGIPGRSLVPIDVSFDLAEPHLLVYESLARMRLHLEEYEYFINIEDDIELPRETMDNIIAFDESAALDVCLHPNRLETRGGADLVIDLEAIAGWRPDERLFRGHVVRVANNPHSGLLILSREKLRYASERVDATFRGLVVGGPMASAFAHWHQPFRLYRSYADKSFHWVRHLDEWYPLAMAPVVQPQPATGLEFSAVLLSWKRTHNLPLIICELRRIPEIKEILLWNNDPERTLQIPGVTVINSGRNFSCYARYALAALAKHDHLWFQDDDLLVSPEQFGALRERYAKDPSRIYGCHGRPVRNGRYVFEEAYGEVDVVTGQTMMFHRRTLRHAFDALGELPPPDCDDISFSLLSSARPVAVDVGGLRDLGMHDGAALHLSAGDAQRRQAAVAEVLGFRRDHPLPARRQAALEEELASRDAELARVRGESADRARDLEAARASGEDARQQAEALRELLAEQAASLGAAREELRAAQAAGRETARRLAASETALQALAGEVSQLKGSVSMRLVEKVRALPLVYSTYLKLKQLR